MHFSYTFVYALIKLPPIQVRRCPSSRSIAMQFFEHGLPEPGATDPVQLGNDKETSQPMERPTCNTSIVTACILIFFVATKPS